MHAPSFRQHVVKHFAPAEDSARTQQEMTQARVQIEEEIEENEEEYNRAKEKRFSDLANLRERKALRLREQISTYDTVVYVDMLKDKLEAIESVKTVAQMEAVQPTQSPISIWFVNTAKLTKLDNKHLCANIGANGKSACEKQDDVGIIRTGYGTLPPLFDGNPLIKKAEDTLSGIINGRFSGETVEQKLERFREGDILSASFMLNAYNESKLLSQGARKMPILGIENRWWQGMYEKFHHKLHAKWHSEHSQHNKRYECVPLHPFLCYFYIFDGENELVLHHSLKKYALMVKDSIQARYLEDPFVRTLKKDDGTFETTKRFPYGKQKMSTSGPDWTQGLTFSDNSKAVFMMFLGTLMVNSSELPSLILDWSSPIENRCLTAYEWICQTQEARLNHMFGKEMIHWSFSEWGASGGFMPSLLAHRGQSMKHLNIRLENNKEVCSACPKDYMTYYGATWYSAVNKKRPKTLKANASGICTQYIDEIADVLELTEEEKRNPWWLNWVGTWEQAQRRLDAYKKKQQEMYDNSDPRYSWIDYYLNLLILQVDLWVKKLFNVCNVKVDDSGDEQAELTEEEKSQWEWVNQKSAGGVAAGAAAGAAAGSFVPILGTAAGAAIGASTAALFAKYGASVVFRSVKEMVRVGGVLLYKVIGLVMRSPMVMEGLLKLAIDYKKTLCYRMAMKQNKFDLVKTDKDGSLKKMNDMGQWIPLTDQAKKDIEAKASEVQKEKDKRKFLQFFAVLQEMGGTDGANFLTQALGATSLYIEGAFSKLVDLLTIIPGISQMFKTTGLTADKLQGMIIVALTTAGQKNFNTIVRANSTMSRLTKFYDVMMNGAQDCLSNGDRLVMKDGGELGEGEQYLNYAWETLHFNVPYYALMILNEMAMNASTFEKDESKTERKYVDRGSIMPWDANFEDKIDEYIQYFTMGQTVPGGEPALSEEQEKLVAEQSEKYESAMQAIEDQFDLELKLFQYQKMQNDLHHKTAEAVTKRLAGDTGMESAKNELAAKYRELAQRNEKFIDDKLAEDYRQQLYWWAGAIAITASAGLFVATGGASAVIQAAVGGAGALTSGAAAATTVGATTAAGTAAAGTAAAGSGLNIAGLIASGATITRTVAASKTLVDTFFSPTEQRLALLYGCSLMYRGFNKASDAMEHWNDQYKQFPINQVLQHQEQWDMIFRAKLREKIIELGAKQRPSMEDTTLERTEKCIELRRVISKQHSLLMKWTDPLTLGFLDIDKCLKTLKSYGDVIV